MRPMREALRNAVRQRPLRYAQIEQALGVKPGYLKALFAGEIDLRVAHVFMILRVIGIDPWKFFVWVHAAEEAAAGPQLPPTPPALPSP